MPQSENKEPLWLIYLNANLLDTIIAETPQAAFRTAREKFALSPDAQVEIDPGDELADAWVDANPGFDDMIL